MTKITFIADTHHYSRALGDTGRAYDLRSGSDFKCLAESGAIIDSAFKIIRNSDTQAVVIAGDLTNNGEIASHIEFTQKIRELSRIKPVFVITATHDWCSDNKPNRYDNDKVLSDVQVYKPQELRKIYSEFGSGNALSEYITKSNLSSYTIDVDKNVRLLMINDDNDETGKAGYSEEHFKWIEEQIKIANEESKTIIGVEHHLIMPHIHKLITIGGQSLNNWEQYSSRLADAGLKYMFVGHSHIQRVSEYTSKSGNTIKQINIGSLVGFPSPIVNITVNEGKLFMDTVYPDEFEYDGNKFDTREYLSNHSFGIISNIVNASKKFGFKELKDRLSALGLNNLSFNKILYIKTLLKYLSKAKVKNLYRTINILTLGKGINKKYAKDFWNIKILEIIKEVFLNAFGGSYSTHDNNSSYYLLIKDVLSVPLLFKRDLVVINDLIECAELIITGGKHSSLKTEL